jgi:hypothetical protein
MNEFVTSIKKNGAIGVLAMWLWYTHTEVQELKVRLYDCMKSGTIIEQNKKSIPDEQKAVAILPKEFDKKRKFA